MDKNTNEIQERHLMRQGQKHPAKKQEIKKFHPVQKYFFTRPCAILTEQEWNSRFFWHPSLFI
jgi:hypothetical protein